MYKKESEITLQQVKCLMKKKSLLTKVCMTSDTHTLILCLYTFLNSKLINGFLIQPIHS